MPNQEESPRTKAEEAGGEVKRRRPRQLELTLRTWGGRRSGAGRKPAGRKATVAHAPRAPLASRFPVHVTLKLRQVIGNPRRRWLTKRIEAAIRAGGNKPDFRVCHFSVQDGHIHLIVEAHDATALSRGVQGLSIRIARKLNQALGRTGKVFADRFHSRILRTPNEVKNALNYVLNNRISHGRRMGFEPGLGVWMDPCSSAAYFDGWKEVPEHPPARAGPRPVVEPHTWLLRTGWRLRGLLVPGEAGKVVARN